MRKGSVAVGDENRQGRDPVRVCVCGASKHSVVDIRFTYY